VRSLQAAANRLGLELHVLNASTERDFGPVFVTLGQLKAGALVIGPDVFFNSHIEQIAALAIAHELPAVYQYRPFVLTWDRVRLDPPIPANTYHDVFGNPQ
jgi:putative ABC transport system substrate-binding protein